MICVHYGRIHCITCGKIPTSFDSINAIHYHICSGEYHCRNCKETIMYSYTNRNGIVSTFYQSTNINLNRSASLTSINLLIYYLCS